ncbi:MAG: hypothetical protein EXS37_08740 [Opitutus sp.]|nr:hypothetical protein [Opitutus sp.]
MAIFSRREIQRRIDRAVPLLVKPQLETIVDRLNRLGRAAVEAEWELIWITSLAQAGRVLHEPRLAKATRYPDLHFKNETVEFVADVTAVSDSGYDEENPVDDLHDALDEL